MQSPGVNYTTGTGIIHHSNDHQSIQEAKGPRIQGSSYSKGGVSRCASNLRGIDARCTGSVTITIVLFRPKNAVDFAILLLVV